MKKSKTPAPTRAKASQPATKPAPQPAIKPAPEPATKTKAKAKSTLPKSAKRAKSADRPTSGGETHQIATGVEPLLTTNQGTPISDNQNSLKSGARGPSLLEDFVHREKITHFDHERIPERIVHARGSGAHGYFVPYGNVSHLTRAKFLQDPSQRTEVFVRFSTVAGGAGSIDLPRDVRGFATKFYTEEGVFDLVGNNIPVFFIQDSMKFPDLVHAVKMEPDRGFPQAATAHDNFWDFVSLMPESMHMLMWAMSDRTIPRSLRMIEGFGVHTFRFVDQEGQSTFIKFHWRPTIGAASVVWDEAMKISGMDPDFHRRDLWQAIDQGDYPEFELGIQAFDQKVADSLPFDILDATKLIPEELVPLTMIGKMVLDRNPDNFFAEVEQIAYHPGHVVPGIDFTNDPLLQGRLFSYTDTQLSRLGTPNFHELPINRPRCPMHNFQRDGQMRHDVPKGRVNYEPNTLGPTTPRESPTAGFTTFPDPLSGDKVRVRSETFADHYSQARMFFRSMTEPEQRHIISAFTFELSKVETVPVRKRMLGHLMNIERQLGEGVEANLGMEGTAEQITPARDPIELEPSPALSILAKAPATLRGRKVGVLVGDGTSATLLDQIKKAVLKEGARLEVIAPKIGGALADDDSPIPANHSITGGASVFFDAVIIATSAEATAELAPEAAAQNWVRDAFAHLKVIGFVAGSELLFQKSAIEPDKGVIAIDKRGGLAKFITAAKGQRVFDREPKLRSPR